MDATGSINTDALENEEEVFDDSEERELVTDSCSTKVLNSFEEPRDKYKIVYMLFYLFGITSLVSWNFFITANDYWMYKFREVTPSNLTRIVRKTQFQAEFTSYINVATAIPNLVFLILNSLYGHLVSIKCRLQGSLIVVTVCFLITTAMVQVDTDSWQNGFFILTIACVVIMTAASAVFMGGLFGIAGRFSGEYMGAVVSGQSLGGIIAAVAQIISLAFKISPLHSALIYFIMADIMVITSMIFYALLYKIDFFTYHILRGGGGIAANRHRAISMTAITKKVWLYATSLFIVYAITIAVYPGVTVLVESHPATAGTDWNNIYFVPVVNYLVFNCGDYAGRLVAGFVLRPNNQWIIAGASVVRVIFVPMLMLCNALPRKHLPVVFLWDWEYILIMIAFSFTNGYLTNIAMINSTKLTELHERETASSLIATMLSVGCAVGAGVGMLLPVVAIKAIHNDRRAAAIGSDAAQGLSAKLELCKGAPVILRQNLFTAAGLCNGTIGTVVDILFEPTVDGDYTEEFPVCIMVDFPNYTGPKYNESTVLPIPPATVYFKENGISYSRKQLPLQLAHAISIHRSQGLTLEKAVVDISKSEFSLGMTYIGLSRVRTLEGLFIVPFPYDRVGNIKNKKDLPIKLNELNRLRHLSNVLTSNLIIFISENKKLFQL